MLCKLERPRGPVALMVGIVLVCFVCVKWGWVIFKAGGVVGVTLGGMFFLLYIVESFGRGASYI